MTEGRHAWHSRPRPTGVCKPFRDWSDEAEAALPPEIEDYRDARWCREGTRQIETAFDAERFIEQAGFASCLTDSRRPGPSLYVAVCGRVMR
jgi:hypothetical protein